MNLIRNGGFEDGTVDFWDVDGGVNIEIESSEVKYGSYAMKATSTNNASFKIINSTYIEVKPYQNIIMTGWVKSSSTRWVYPHIWFYDSDYSLITDVNSYGINNHTNYAQFTGVFTVPEDAKYARLGVNINNNNSGDVYYLDSLNAQFLDAKDMIYGEKELIAASGVTSSGDSSSDQKVLPNFNKYYADLNVGYLSGSSPTLEISVYEYTDLMGAVVLGTFTTATSTTFERIELSKCTGRGLYVEYTIGGSGVTAYFNVKVRGLR